MCFLVTFCLVDLSIGVNGVLKSPTIIVLLLISPFKLVSICLIYCGAPMLGAYIFIIIISYSFCLFSRPLFWTLFYLIWVLLLLLSFGCHLPGISFSSPSLSVFMCLLFLRWVSCRQHIQGSCFCIHSASHCLLVGVFNPFTYMVIIGNNDPTAIYFVVLGLSNLFWVSSVEKIL